MVMKCVFRKTDTTKKMIAVNVEGVSAKAMKRGGGGEEGDAEFAREHKGV